MKKIMAILLSAAMLIYALTGCGSSGKLSGSVSTNGSTSMEKVIGVLSEQFMTDNKDVTVTYDATGSGTRDGFERITKNADTCVLAQEMTSTGAVIAAVQSSENAIGYASFASVEGQSGIKVLTVAGVSCTAENILNGSYVIQSPFNLVTKSDEKLSDAAQAFFDYMTSKEAASLIADAGAVPVAK